MKEGKDILIVIDMQNDFIDGALGTPEAQSIVPNVVKKIEKAREEGKEIIFTKDTHGNDYLNTQEGKFLPIPHCIRGSDGWEICSEIVITGEDNIINKPSFGCSDWYWEIIEPISSIEMIGLCTDICVISNALILKSEYPEIPITVDASCCAGVTPEKHKAALETMKSCQINVINE